MNTPELLAPAGDFAIAQMAFDHGADAIYIGVGQLNLRAHSPNFAVDDLPELLQTAAKRNKKVYVALNIMPDDRRLNEVESTLHSIKNLGVLPDAFIISDPGVYCYVKDSSTGSTASEHPDRDVHSFSSVLEKSGDKQNRASTRTQFGSDFPIESIETSGNRDICSWSHVRFDLGALSSGSLPEWKTS